MNPEGHTKLTIRKFLLKTAIRSMECNVNWKTKKSEKKITKVYFQIRKIIRTRPLRAGFFVLIYYGRYYK